MFCHSCGEELSEGSIYCSKCGEKISSVNENEPNQAINVYESQKGKAVLVFGLLGILGIISCGILSFFSIPAWVMGNGELKKHPNDERLKAGKIMGIIGVVLLSVTIVVVAYLVSGNIEKMAINHR